MAHVVDFVELKPQKTFLYIFAKYKTHENYQPYGIPHQLQCMLSLLHHEIMSE